jgi:hypothetical protein
LKSTATAVLFLKGEAFSAFSRRRRRRGVSTADDKITQTLVCPLSPHQSARFLSLTASPSGEALKKQKTDAVRPFFFA